MENKILLLQLQKMKKDPSVNIDLNGGGNSKEFSLPKHDLTDITCARESKEELTKLSATGSMVGISLLFIYFIMVGRFLLSMVINCLILVRKS